MPTTNGSIPLMCAVFFDRDFEATFSVFDEVLLSAAIDLRETKAHLSRLPKIFSCHGIWQTLQRVDSLQNILEYCN